MNVGKITWRGKQYIIRYRIVDHGGLVFADLSDKHGHVHRIFKSTNDDWLTKWPDDLNKIISTFLNNQKVDEHIHPTDHWT